MAATKQLLDKNHFPNERSFKKLLASIESTVESLEAQAKAHKTYEKELMYSMIEKIKRNVINVGPLQEPLQSVPYTTGVKRVLERKKLVESVGKKKRKEK